MSYKSHRQRLELPWADLLTRLLVAAGLSMFLFIGCGQGKVPSGSPAGTRKTILIGLLPEQNIFKQLDRYEPIAAYLSAKTGTKITLKILPRYGNVIDNFNLAGMDGAFFGSFTYALANAKLGVEVLARPEWLDNTSTYHGLIFVRKDSGIGTAADMKGKRFAFVDRATTAGYLFPLRYLHRKGIDWKEHLKEGYFAGTHEAAISDVLNKKADIGASKNTVFDRMAQSDPRVRKDLLVLETSPEVPENSLALRKDIDESIRRGLKAALIEMHLDPKGRMVLEQFGARRFVETTNKDYESVLRYAKETRLNLATYDYAND